MHSSAPARSTACNSSRRLTGSSSTGSCGKDAWSVWLPAYMSCTPVSPASGWYRKRLPAPARAGPSIRRVRPSEVRANEPNLPQALNTPIPDDPRAPHPQPRRKSMTTSFNSKLDLTFERIVDVPPRLVWRAWTEPELIKQWFCPLPWKVIEAEVDVCPGGMFRTSMQSPEGEVYPNIGCFLVTIPNEKLVWTNALLPGFRPALMNAPCGDESAAFMFTASVEMAPHGENSTRYRASVIHANEAVCRTHAAMGCEEGWGVALDQLVAMIKRGI